MVAGLVVVTGGKGGPGATTLAVGLAAAWARGGQRVLLVDLDAAGGDVAAHVWVGKIRGRGVAAVLAAAGGGGRVEPRAVAAEAVQVTANLGVLVGLPRADAAGLLRPQAAMAVAQAIRQVGGVDLVVVDAGRLLPGSVGAGLLGLPGAVGVLAARADVPGALAAQRALLVAAETTAKPLALVAVGVRGRMSGDVAELAKALEHPVSGVIPAWRRQLDRAIHTGQPPTGGRLGRAYQALAGALWPPDDGDRARLAARGRHARRRRGSVGRGEREAASA
jgi:MinD-like ATPase involved in chromosome partitioning or flagellar assembly